MLVLDCESPTTTERSLSGLLGVTRVDLHNRCRDFDLHHFYEREWGPASKLLPRILGIDVPEGRYPSYFFHATRMIPVASPFCDGLLPLGHAVANVWDSLWPLASRYCSERAWREFRYSVGTNHPSHYAHLYRMKTNDVLHWGPYGFLIREVPVYKATTGKGPWHDYLGVSEIVEDICTAFLESFGRDLAKDYVGASRPYLVKFEAQDDAFFLGTALLYLCHSIHRLELTTDVGSCHDAGGQRIPATAIVRVEIDPR